MGDAVPTSTKVDRFTAQPNDTRKDPKRRSIVSTIVIESIPVYCCLWRGQVLLRRCDSDFGEFFSFSHPEEHLIPISMQLT
jgi:hypothetical protein